jgi:hypothetical protein
MDLRALGTMDSTYTSTIPTAATAALDDTTRSRAERIWRYYSAGFPESTLASRTGISATSSRKAFNVKHTTAEARQTMYQALRVDSEPPLRGQSTSKPKQNRRTQSCGIFCR